MVKKVFSAGFSAEKSASEPLTKDDLFSEFNSYSLAYKFLWFIWIATTIGLIYCSFVDIRMFKDLFPVHTLMTGFFMGYNGGRR